MERRPTIVALIQHVDGEFLVVRSIKTSRSSFVQGEIKPQECAIGALFREPNEEVGISPVDIVHYSHLWIGSTDSTSSTANGFTRGVCYICYHVTYSGSKNLVVDHEEIDAYEWLTREKTRELIKGFNEETHGGKKRVLLQAFRMFEIQNGYK